MADSASFIKFSFAFIKISIICFDHRKNDPKSLYRQILNTSLLSLPTDKVAFNFRSIVKQISCILCFLVGIVCACVLSSCHGYRTYSRHALQFCDTDKSLHFMTRSTTGSPSNKIETTVSLLIIYQQLPVVSTLRRHKTLFWSAVSLQQDSGSSSS
jgi:hypothetical protein